MCTNNTCVGATKRTKGISNSEYGSSKSCAICGRPGCTADVCPFKQGNFTEKEIDEAVCREGGRARRGRALGIAPVGFLHKNRVPGAAALAPDKPPKETKEERTERLRMEREAEKKRLQKEKEEKEEKEKQDKVKREEEAATKRKEEAEKKKVAKENATRIKREKAQEEERKMAKAKFDREQRTSKEAAHIPITNMLCF